MTTEVPPLTPLYEAAVRHEPLGRVLARAAEVLDGSIPGAYSAIFVLRESRFCGYTALGEPGRIWGRFEGTHPEQGPRQAPWWTHRGGAVEVEKSPAWRPYLAEGERLAWPYVWCGELRTPAGEIVGAAVALTPETPGERVLEGWEAVAGVAALVVEQENMVAELTWQAERDALTGLFNLPRFERALDALLAAPAADGAALLWLSLDRWTRINRLLGHATGDGILHEAANRLRGALRSQDVCARVGEREFACALNGIPERKAEEAVRRLQAALSAPYEVNGHLLTLETVAALCRLDGEARSGAEWMRRARLALAHARSPAQRFAVFTPEMAAKAGDRLELEQRLRQARANGELHLLFQPQVRLTGGRACGVEALVRWRAGELGLVSPGVFIPIAEETGLIGEFGEWVLEEACRQGKRWRDAGHDLRIGVMISPKQMSGHSLAAKVEAALALTGLPPELLELEITESGVLADLPLAAAILERLKKIGVWVALDGFGTGHSSLAYLRDLPVDRVRIDRSFLAAAEEDASLLGDIIRIAQDLGLETIAEGVETDRQRDILRRFRCDQGQGSRWGPPMPAEELEAWLRRQPAA
jgi:diguanylate cyclase (GGDEF)-like protein